MIFDAFPAFAVVAEAPAQPAGEEMLYDRKGRPVIATRVNDRGPFYMVVDTAADSSLFAPALMDELGLAPLHAKLTVNGATGAAQARFYPIDRFSSALFDVRRVGLPAMAGPAVAQARGIIGMDLFEGRRLVFDRIARRVTAEPSGPPAAGFVAVRGRIMSGGFVVVPVTIDGVAVQALIDSGADGSVANAATLKALGWKADDPRLKDGGTIGGATTGRTRVREGTVGVLRVGPVNMRAIPVAFTDAAILDGMGIGDDVPAMILGSDLLNALLGYAVDFPRGELHIRMPAMPAK